MAQISSTSVLHSTGLRIHSHKALVNARQTESKHVRGAGQVITRSLLPTTCDCALAKPLCSAFTATENTAQLNLRENLVYGGPEGDGRLSQTVVAALSNRPPVDLTGSRICVQRRGDCVHRPARRGTEPHGFHQTSPGFASPPDSTRGSLKSGSKEGLHASKAQWALVWHGTTHACTCVAYCHLHPALATFCSGSHVPRSPLEDQSGLSRESFFIAHRAVGQVVPALPYVITIQDSLLMC
jgi:hypothetical protein